MGNFVGKEEDKAVQRLGEWRRTAVRIGRRRLRWPEDVKADPGKMKIQNWTKMPVGMRRRGRKLLSRPKSIRTTTRHGVTCRDLPCVDTISVSANSNIAV
jgi:hypothetical protein